MDNKKLLVIILAIVAVGGLIYLFTRNQATVNNNPSGSNNTTDQSGNRTVPPTNTEGQATSTLKVATFAGKLEQVNTGCFADGECYVVVAGRHVTTLVGFSQSVVGSIQGVDSISDLESQIGREVEVYAQDKGDGTYTLYGSSGFYVRLAK